MSVVYRHPPLPVSDSVRQTRFTSCKSTPRYTPQSVLLAPQVPMSSSPWESCWFNGLCLTWKRASCKRQGVSPSEKSFVFSISDLSTPRITTTRPRARTHPPICIFAVTFADVGHYTAPDPNSNVSTKTAFPGLHFPNGNKILRQQTAMHQKKSRNLAIL